MTDAIQKAKSKNPYIDWKNRPYASNPNAEQKRKEAEAFSALGDFIRRAGGWVVSPPGRTLRIEAMKGSPLPTKLRELGYHVAERESVTRITGAPSIDARTQRLTGVTPSAFLECDVIEITLSGK